MRIVGELASHIALLTPPQVPPVHHLPPVNHAVDLSQTCGKENPCWCHCSRKATYRTVSLCQLWNKCWWQCCWWLWSQPAIAPLSLVKPLSQQKNPAALLLRSPYESLWQSQKRKIYICCCNNQPKWFSLSPVKMMLSGKALLSSITVSVSALQVTILIDWLSSKTEIQKLQNNLNI